MNFSIEEEKNIQQPVADENIQEQTETTQETNEQTIQNDTVKKEQQEQQPRKTHDARRWEKLMRELKEYKTKMAELQGKLEAYKEVILSKNKDETPTEDTPEPDNKKKDLDALVESKIINTLQKINPALFAVKQEIPKEELKKAFDDFDDVIANAYEITIPEHVEDYLKSSTKKDLLVYYLSKYPDKAEEISNLPPVKAIAELGKLELLAETEYKNKSKKQVSAAPTPIKSVSGYGNKVDLTKISDKDYIKLKLSGKI